MCNLALSDAGIKRFSTVNQQFRLPISPHDQHRWHRDGWAVCPRWALPKRLKEMRRVARLAKCLQSGEIRASPVKHSGVRMHSGAQMCIAPVRRWIRSYKENVGISSIIPDIITRPDSAEAQPRLFFRSPNNYSAAYLLTVWPYVVMPLRIVVPTLVSPARDAN